LKYLKISNIFGKYNTVYVPGTDATEVKSEQISIDTLSNANTLEMYNFGYESSLVQNSVEKELGFTDLLESRNLDVEKDIIAQAIVQDRYCFDPEKKWQCSEYYLDTAVTSNTELAVHYISTSARTDGTLEGTAEYINKKFMEYPLKKGAGWIFCDFPKEELIEKIMTSNIEKSEVK
jgi:hypothetical protein